MKGDESIVSFDITSYYTNVPVKEALIALRFWLDKQNLNPLEGDALFDLTETCVGQLYFQFRDSFYKQTDGMPMGNSLSGFLCNLYVNSLEEKLSHQQKLPEVWHRYIDDVLAIVKTSEIENTLTTINGACNKIQFTVEIEENGALPFLDLVVKRNATDTIEFEIYRKSTGTDRYITNDSNHYTSHKYAAFNSMAYRLCNVPLSNECYIAELNRIKNIANVNGYCNDSIQKLVDKHMKAKVKRNATSLSPINEDTKRIAIEYHPHIFGRLKSEFKNHNIDLIPRSSTKIKNLMHSTKDHIDNDNKSGVYAATCSTCSKQYIGQTIRQLKVRKKEHIRNIKNKESYASGLAEHILTERHSIDDTHFSLLEHESNRRRLNVLESMHIHLTHENNVNRDDGPSYSSLFHLLDKQNSGI